jgi:hypothetical protein
MKMAIDSPNNDLRKKQTLTSFGCASHVGACCSLSTISSSLAS